MKITLYKHIPSKKFDDPERITLFPETTRLNYALYYSQYLQSAQVWQGDGKTYLIDLTQVCDIPAAAYNATLKGRNRPVYLQSYDSLTGERRFYYVTSIDFTANTVRLTLLLDTFATYYEFADFGNYNDSYSYDPTIKPITVTRSTLKLADRVILAPEEVTPPYRTAFETDPAYYQTRGILSLGGGAGNQLAFLFKAKFLSAKTISTEAYSIRLFFIPITDTTYNGVLSLYNKILNIYEIVSDTLGIGLECEIEELYIVPRGFVTALSPIEPVFRYVSTSTGARETISGYVCKMGLGYAKTITGNKTGGGKLLIGVNEVDLPAYYGNIHFQVKIVDDLNDFDVILSVENNQPQSIKNFFQVEVARSTQETSLQLIARVFGYIQTGTSALKAAGQQAAISTATGNPLGLLAAGNTIKGAGDQIAGSLITAATKEALPSTNFKTSGFSVFFEAGTFTLKQYWISQLYYDGNSQAEANLKRYGVEWYNAIGFLEDCIDQYTPIVEGGRIYIEADTTVTGIPLDYANEIEGLLKAGVEIINGDG